MIVPKENTNGYLCNSGENVPTHATKAKFKIFYLKANKFNV